MDELCAALDAEVATTAKSNAKARLPAQRVLRRWLKPFDSAAFQRGTNWVVVCRMSGSHLAYGGTSAGCVPRGLRGRMVRGASPYAYCHRPTRIVMLAPAFVLLDACHCTLRNRIQISASLVQCSRTAIPVYGSPCAYPCLTFAHGATRRPMRGVCSRELQVRGW